VSIHPFPNGNGRHARLAADLLMVFAGNTRFSWGGQSIDVEGVTRTNYLDALRAADRGNYARLIEFAKRE
jgi:fido (protein-threonine AMPylation protein)